MGGGARCYGDDAKAAEGGEGERWECEEFEGELANDGAGGEASRADRAEGTGERASMSHAVRTIRGRADRTGFFTG